MESARRVAHLPDAHPAIVARFRHERHHRAASAASVRRARPTYQPSRCRVADEHLVTSAGRTAQFHGHALAAPRTDRVFRDGDAANALPGVIAVAVVVEWTAPVTLGR